MHEAYTVGESVVVVLTPSKTPAFLFNLSPSKTPFKIPAFQFNTLSACIGVTLAH